MSNHKNSSNGIAWISENTSIYWVTALVAAAVFYFMESALVDLPHVPDWHSCPPKESTLTSFATAPSAGEQINSIWEMFSSTQIANDMVRMDEFKLGGVLTIDQLIQSPLKKNYQFIKMIWPDIVIKFEIEVSFPKTMEI